MSKLVARWAALPLFVLAIAFIHPDLPDLLVALALAISAQFLLMYGTDYL